MSHAFTRLAAIAAFLASVAIVPLALSADSPPPHDETKAVAPVPETAVEPTAPAGEAEASKAMTEEPATAAAVAPANEAVKNADEWVCRKETPTGSHRSIRACRRRADIEAAAAEVDRTMSRQRHYNNPTVTPGD